MKITSVSVRKGEFKDSNVKAIVSVVLDGCFAVSDIRIIDGKNGLFLAMPNRRRKNGEYKDVANPINEETRKMFNDAIFEEYNKQD